MEVVVFIDKQPPLLMKLYLTVSRAEMFMNEIIFINHVGHPSSSVGTACNQRRKALSSPADLWPFCCLPNAKHQHCGLVAGPAYQPTALVFDKLGMRLNNQLSLHRIFRRLVLRI